MIEEYLVVEIPGGRGFLTVLSGEVLEAATLGSAATIDHCIAQAALPCTFRREVTRAALGRSHSVDVDEETTLLADRFPDGLDQCRVAGGSARLGVRAIAPFFKQCV